jgi:hypothetical protein
MPDATSSLDVQVKGDPISVKADRKKGVSWRPKRDVCYMTREEVYQVAGFAACDVRTVERYASGGKIRPLLRERIEAAMKKLKIKK